MRTTENREPLRKRATIVVDGADVATPHHYIRTDVKPCPKFGTLRPEHHFVFADDATGVERVFGMEGAPTPDNTEAWS